MSKLANRFDWFTVLAKLSNGEMISRERYINLRNKAGQWPHCACGQLCDLLEHQFDGSPVDVRLYKMGVKFSEYVDAKQWCKALKTFKAIEKRSTVLLKEKGIIDADGIPTANPHS